MPGWTKVGVPTIGQCKGTLEAVCAADMIVIFHVPLFSRWLKTVMDGGTRVLMIIDAPDELEQLMSPPGLKEACKHAEALYRETAQVRVTSDAGTDLTLYLRRISGDDAVGLCRRAAATSTTGARGHIHTFPNEGSAHGTVVFAAGRHRHPAVLPLRRRSGDAHRSRRPRRRTSRAASTRS